jgi:hypothetical protein
MLITDDFVMLNFPKTGSTFAREAIKQIYTTKESKTRTLLSNFGICRPEIIELLLPHIDDDTNIIDQHGTLRQIPFEHRNKPVVSIVRNPFSRYQSIYFFRWWQQYPPTDTQVIRESFPNFPNLSFSEYYEMINNFGSESRLHGIVPKIDLGYLTIQFIQFYFKDPESILKRIDNEYIESRQFEKDLENIHFIHTENLRKELKEYLMHVGITQNQVDFLDSKKKANVTDRKNGILNGQDELITPVIENQIREKDKLMFTIFPIYKERLAMNSE